MVFLISQDHFASLFGGPSVALGKKLCDHLFPHEHFLDLQHFIVSMTAMKTRIVDNSDPSQFLFEVFFTSEKDFDSGLHRPLQQDVSSLLMLVDFIL